MFFSNKTRSFSSNVFPFDLLIFMLLPIAIGPTASHILNVFDLVGRRILDIIHIRILIAQLLNAFPRERIAPAACLGMTVHIAMMLLSP